MNFLNILKKIGSKNSKIEHTSTQSAYFIKNNYHHRLKPEYLDIFGRESEIVWQPHVYELVAKMARRFNCKYIIDIGCGSAEKLTVLYPEFEIIGVDYGDNLNNCRKKYSFGTWLNYNLEDSSKIILSKEILSKSAIICSDVIEHLINPIPLLNNIKNLLSFSPFCIITTPERDLVRGKNHYGPPNNSHHVREWNLEEFEKLLQSYGLKITFMGLTVSNNNENFKKTMIVGINNHYSSIIPNIWNECNDDHTKMLKKYYQ